MTALRSVKRQKPWTVSTEHFFGNQAPIHKANILKTVTLKSPVISGGDPLQLGIEIIAWVKTRKLFVFLLHPPRVSQAFRFYLKF